MIALCRKQRVINTQKGEILTINARKLLTIGARGILVMLGVLALLVTFAATSRQASAHSKAFVRVVHAAPGAPIVDVYVDGSKLLNDFPFGSVTSYVAVAERSHRMQVTPDGANRRKSVIDVTVSLEGGTYYTVAALGTTSSSFSLKAFVDNNWDSNAKATVRAYVALPHEVQGAARKAR